MHYVKLPVQQRQGEKEKERGKDALGLGSSHLAQILDQARPNEGLTMGGQGPQVGGRANSKRAQARVCMEKEENDIKYTMEGVKEG